MIVPYVVHTAPGQLTKRCAMRVAQARYRCAAVCAAFNPFGRIGRSVGCFGVHGVLRGVHQGALGGCPSQTDVDISCSRPVHWQLGVNSCRRVGAVAAERLVKLGDVVQNLVVGGEQDRLRRKGEMR